MINHDKCQQRRKNLKHFWQLQNGSPTLGLFYYTGIKLSRNHTRYSNRLGRSGNDIH